MMRFNLSFYGAEARILGMMHRRNIIYLSILKLIAKEMGGRVPDRFRDMVIRHAAEAADTAIKDESRFGIGSKESIIRYS